ncbi:MAG: energy transducer TonB [bacterium]|nr:energy transducer TonB [bacterium]
MKKWRIVQAKPPDLGFEQEVEKVLPKWKFTPAIQQGNPVGVWIAIPFNFKVQ